MTQPPTDPPPPTPPSVEPPTRPTAAPPTAPTTSPSIIPSISPPNWAASATVSRLPPPMASALEAEVREAVAWLREEVGSSQVKGRQARLLAEIGDFEERTGDEPGAARDYLAAFNADPSFRESLEGLIRLLERRRSYRNLGKVIDALVKASSKRPEEAARALLMKAAFAADVSEDLFAARDAALLAAKAATSGPESALAWLTLEILAGKLGDPDLRRESLAKRIAHTNDPTWRGLLLLDLGQLTADGGDVSTALALFREAQLLGGGATYRVTVAAARLIRRDPGAPGTEDATRRAKLYASVLEAQGGLIRDAIAAPERGDQLGVPRWARNRAHMVDAWLRAADALAGSSELDGAARVLDRAIAAMDEAPAGAADPTDRLVARALTRARMRVAERQGDASHAATLAKQMLHDEADPRMASSLAARVAERALADGDTVAAHEALASALSRDPGNVATRSLQLDLAVKTADSARLSGELAVYAEQLASPDARARMLLIAAVLAGAEAGDAAKGCSLLAAAAALTPAAGVPSAPGITARLARLIAAVRGDATLRETATRDLLASGAEEREQADLWFEVVRAAFARGAETDAEVSLQALAEAPDGAWLAGALEAFLPGRGPGQTAAFDGLAALEGDGSAMPLLAALRAHHEGDADGARRRLRALLDATPDDVLVMTLLAELERRSGSLVHAADTASRGAASVDDPELSAALHLEAGLDRWRGADRKGAIESFELAARGAPEAAKPLLRWSSRGVDMDTLEGRRAAIERAGRAGEDGIVLALERFSTELQGGDAVDAEQALSGLDDTADGPLRIAGDLARIVAPERAFSPDAAALALQRIAALGDVAATAAAAEEFRTALAREGAQAEGARSAARGWFDVGGGSAAALEWLGASLGTTDEVPAARAVASLFTGEARETLLASSALLEASSNGGVAGEWVAGDAPAVRLVNLELSPPGFDLARRARALTEADAALGGDGAAVSLSGWSLLASGNAAKALEAFRQAVQTSGDDLAAWAGAQAAARLTGDKAAQVEAATALAERCKDAARGAKLWEEAGLALLELERGDDAEKAFDTAFRSDPTRVVAFDRLFRRVRDRKDGEKLLALIAARLESSDDPAEIVKLYWERSRVLREKGDVDGAMVALENVTMVEPDHVGALALTGEIFIRRGQFAEAAETLARLARIESAPAKNRATAGIAAVDLFENKLAQPDRALEILVVLHKANLTNLAVRERLARSAAKAGSWEQAASILEELMLERPTPAARIEAAGLAMAIRRDRLSDRAGATKAMTRLLEESPAHGDAVDMLLDAPIAEDARLRLLRGAREGLLAEIDRTPTGVAAVRRLAKVAHALHDRALEQTALAASAVLGPLDDADRSALARLSHANATFPKITLTEAHHRTVVASGDEGPVADLFATLGPTLAEALGPTLAVMGVGRKERVDARAGSPVRQEVAAWAGAFGLAEFELYVGGRDAMGVQGIPGEPHLLVVGADVRAPFGPSTRARIARELFALSRGTNVLRTRDETTVLAIVVAACRLGGVPIDAPVYAVQAEIDRLVGKAIARRAKRLLPEICRHVVQTKADAREWSQRAIATLDRIAVIATGDVGVVLGDIHGQPPERLADIIQGDRRSEELLRFAVSTGYLDVRRTLGLEGTP
jgi:tetratricopeptide (TPR) repeat protein